MDSELYDRTLDTCLFWDVEDFPIPIGLDFDYFLRKLPTRGMRLTVHAFGDEKTPEERANFYKAHILLYEAVEKRARLNTLILDMLECALIYPEANFLVAAKDIPDKETELFSVFEGLRKRGYKVLFLVLNDLESLPRTNTASLVWRWTSFEYTPGFFETDTEEGSEDIDEDFEETDTEEGSDVAWRWTSLLVGETPFESNSNGLRK